MGLCIEKSPVGGVVSVSARQCAGGVELVGAERGSISCRAEGIPRQIGAGFVDGLS